MPPKFGLALEWYYKIPLERTSQDYRTRNIFIHFSNGYKTVISLEAAQSIYSKYMQYESSQYYYQSQQHDYWQQVNVYADWNSQTQAPVSPYSSRNQTAPVCKSCGGSHQGKLDRIGRCETTIKKFWEKVRKLYWHRRLQETNN